jgi:hypothetical protein
VGGDTGNAEAVWHTAYAKLSRGAVNTASAGAQKAMGEELFGGVRHGFSPMGRLSRKSYTVLYNICRKIASFLWYFFVYKLTFSWYNSIWFKLAFRFPKAIRTPDR